MDWKNVKIKTAEISICKICNKKYTRYFGDNSICEKCKKEKYV